MVKLIGKNEFDSEVRGSQGKALVDFYADWCGPCKMQAPIVDKLSEEMADVRFYKVNVDEALPLAMEFGIASIPTIMILKDGEVTYCQPGLCQKAELVELLG